MILYYVYNTAEEKISLIVLTLRRIEIWRGGCRVVIVAAVLAVSSVLATGCGLERAGRKAHDRRCRVERYRSSSIHMLMCAHLLPETSPTITEPHLYSGLGQFGSEDKNKQNRGYKYRNINGG